MRADDLLNLHLLVRQRVFQILQIWYMSFEVYVRNRFLFGYRTIKLIKLAKARYPGAKWPSYCSYDVAITNPSGK